MPFQNQPFPASLRIPNAGGLIDAGSNNPSAIRRKSDRCDSTAMTLQTEKFLAAGRVPNDCRGITTAGDNPLALRGKRGDLIASPAEQCLLQVTLPLPIEPFKPAIRKVLTILQQLSQAADIILIPSLLG